MPMDYLYLGAIVLLILTLSWLGYRHISSLDSRMRNIEKLISNIDIVQSGGDI